MSAGTGPEGADAGRRRWPSHGNVCASGFFAWLLGIESGVYGVVIAASDNEERLDTGFEGGGCGGGRREVVGPNEGDGGGRGEIGCAGIGGGSARTPEPLCDVNGRYAETGLRGVVPPRPNGGGGGSTRGDLGEGMMW